MRSSDGALALCLAAIGCAQPDDWVARVPVFELPAHRRIAWAGHAGVPAEIQTPAQICADVSRAPYFAVGDGITDAQPAIQAALDACPDNQVVFVPAGTWRLSAGLRLRREGQVLRGAGPGQTTLLMAGDDNVIGQWPDSFEVLSWVGGYEKGATALELSRTDSLEPGQELLLDQLNDPAVVVADDMVLPQTCSRSGTAIEGGNSRTELQLVRVTAIDGNTVHIDPPLNREHQAALVPEAFAWSSVSHRGSLRRLGVEDLTVDGSATSEVPQQLDFQFCSFCWVRNVEIVNSGHAAIGFFFSLQSEVTGSYLHDSRAPTGPERFGVRMDMTSGVRVENNVFRRLNSPVVFACPNSGAVVAYNFAEDLSPGSADLFSFATTLASHNEFHLFEGNVAAKVLFAAAEGSASHLTVFRNRLLGWESGKTNENVPLVIEASNRWVNVVGNVLGSAGHHDVYEANAEEAPVTGVPIYRLGYPGGGAQQPDPQVSGTLLRHGNFDTVTGAARWTSGSSHRLPDSLLYLSGPPAYWGSAAWPPFGPEGRDAEIPAQARARTLSP